MIDKSWKLQRYDRKDYTELVEFPVEIVGRDGVIRRYSFEDAIRLYQRRITFAGVRYRDTDLALAETGHCAARVEQLRRSYFHRFGWPTPSGEPAADAVLGAMAGELAAFLARVLQRGSRLDVRVEPVDVAPDGAGTWYVRPAIARGAGSWGALLYVHRFDAGGRGGVPGAADAGAVDAFVARLRELEARRPEGADAERLIGAHQSLDCGFLLTGDEVSALRIAEGGEEEWVDLGPTPWEEAIESIRRGDHAGALRRCREVVAAQPWHRKAWLAGAILATAQEDLVTAEELALLGGKYFPEDGHLRHWLAVVRQRAGRLSEAEQAAREAVALAPDHEPSRLLLAGLLLRAGRVGEARAALRHACGGPSDVRWLATGLAWRSRLGTASVAAATLVPAVLWFLPLAATLPALGAVIGLLGWYRLGRDIEAGVVGARPDEVATALRRVTRREAPPGLS